jgi:hypothetical protein
VHQVDVRRNTLRKEVLNGGGKKWRNSRDGKALDVLHLEPDSLRNQDYVIVLDSYVWDRRGWAILL